MRTYILSLIGLTTLSFCLGISSAAAAPRSAPVAVRDAHEWAHRLPTLGVSAVTARLLRIERQSVKRAEIWKGIEASQRRMQLGGTSIPRRHLLAGPPSTCDGRAATIVGTDSNDVIKGTAGRDVIVGLGGDDEIRALAQNDIVCGGPGDDVIWGGGRDDRIFGGDGHDLIDAGSGNDLSDGGPGDRDGATFWDAPGPITASLVTGTATGDGSDTFTNVEELHGGNFNDTLTGDAGPNSMFGLDGNDVLSGGDGSDSIHGGEGNDVIDGGAGQFDSVGFYAAAGPITASLVTGTSSGQGNDMFANVEALNGGPYDDTLIGSSGDNWLFGADGNDTLSGGAGTDFLDGGAGDDRIDGGSGTLDAAAFFDETGPVTASLATGTAIGQGSDAFTNVEQLHGGDFNDTFTGNDGDNGFFGNGGNDTISAGAGNDNLDGGPGDDILDGGAGFDNLGFFFATGPITASLASGTSSGQGTDTFTSVEALSGGPFGDNLTGGSTDGWLLGNAGNDTLNGGAGNEYLGGGDGADVLNGGDSNDTLDGGSGDDTLAGGAGFDAAAFFDAPGPINASLASGSASGDGADTFSNVEQIQGSNYADTLYGGAADGWLSGNGGDDTINGGSADEFLFGGDGSDTISGSAGDDFLAPGSGTDTLDGGPGFDKAAYWDASGPITASLTTNTATGDGMDSYTSIEGIHGGNYGDTLTGSSADEEFFGNGGDDTISAGIGNDVLNGGDGNDSLYGEAGNDYLDGADGADFLDGGPDWDTCVNGETTINCES